MDLAQLALQIDTSGLKNLSTASDKATNNLFLMNLKLTEVIRLLGNLNTTSSHTSNTIQRTTSSMNHMGTAIYRIGQSLQYANVPMANAIGVFTNLASTVLNLGPAANMTARGIGALGVAVGGTVATVLGLGTAFGLVSLAVAGWSKAIIDGRLETIQMADASQRLANELAVVTSTNAAASRVWSQLYQVAYDTRASVDATIDSFARMSRATEHLKLSQAGVVYTTELLNKALLVGGPTAQEVRSGMVQLSQALAKGKVDGDEFRSLMENFPYLMRQVAAGFGKAGVSIGELKESSSTGKLTADAFLSALYKGAERIDRDFKKTTLTVEQGGLRVKNALTNLFKPVIDDQGRFQSEFPKTIQLLTDLAKTVEGGIGQSLKNVFVGAIESMSQFGSKFLALVNDMFDKGGLGGLVTGNIRGGGFIPHQSREFLEQDQKNIKEIRTQIQTEIDNINQMRAGAGSWFTGRDAVLQKKLAELTKELANVEQASTAVDRALASVSRTAADTRLDVLSASAKQLSSALGEVTENSKLIISDMNRLANAKTLDEVLEIKAANDLLSDLRRKVSGAQLIPEQDQARRLQLQQQIADLEDTGRGSSQLAVKYQEELVTLTTQLAANKQVIVSKDFEEAKAAKLALDRATALADQNTKNMRETAVLKARARELAVDLDLDPRKTGFDQYITKVRAVAEETFKLRYEQESALSSNELTGPAKDNYDERRKAYVALQEIEAKRSFIAANRPKENQAERDALAIRAILTKATNELALAEQQYNNAKTLPLAEAERQNKILSDEAAARNTAMQQLDKRGATKEETDELIKKTRQLALYNDQQRLEFEYKRRLESFQDSAASDALSVSLQKQMALSGEYLTLQDTALSRKQFELELLMEEADLRREIDKLVINPEQKQSLYEQIKLQQQNARAINEVNELINAQRAVRSLLDNVAGNVATSFVDVAFGARTAKEAIVDLAQSAIRFLAELAIKMAILKGLGVLASDASSPSGMSGLGNFLAQMLGVGLSAAAGGGGATVNGGALIPASTPIIPTALGPPSANGNIIDRPGNMYGGGRRHRVGERGPEVVMPLMRDAFGRLGVGGKGGGRPVAVAVNLTVNNNGPGSSSGADQARQMGSIIKQQVESTVKRILLDEQRSGGILA